MAFLKLIGSLFLGGGIGYGLLSIVSPKESDIIKHLPPRSSQQQNFFKLYKGKPEEFMNLGKPNISLKQYKTEKNTDITEK